MSARRVEHLGATLVLSDPHAVVHPEEIRALQHTGRQLNRKGDVQRRRTDLRPRQLNGRVACTAGVPLHSWVAADAKRLGRQLQRPRGCIVSWQAGRLNRRRRRRRLPDAARGQPGFIGTPCGICHRLRDARIRPRLKLRLTCCAAGEQEGERNSPRDRNWDSQFHAVHRDPIGVPPFHASPANSGRSAKSWSQHEFSANPSEQARNFHTTGTVKPETAGRHRRGRRCECGKCG